MNSVDAFSAFINANSARRVLSLAGMHVGLDEWRRLIGAFLLPEYRKDGEELILAADFEELSPVFSYVSSGSGYLKDDLFGNTSDGVLQVLDLLSVEFSASKDDIPHIFYSGLRNLITHSASLRQTSREHITLPYYPLTRIITTEQNVADIAAEQKSRHEHLERMRSSQFANSAYYMGSKRSLAGFLVEGISSELPSDGVILDLMCGSGSAAGAFAQFWRTYASDAQKFCTYLARIQGGGFTVSSAEEVLGLLQPQLKTHTQALGSLLAKPLEEEDAIFNGATTDDPVSAYRQFVTLLPLFPNTGKFGSWDPCCEVELRQQNRRTFPYCLFSAYFANVYFGLRQCVEIDGLRYAIDQIENPFYREWAMGALITAVSAIGTTYGGHFAQPPFSRPEDINESNVFRLVRRRNASVFHEFSIRLLNLAAESAKTPFPVQTTPGPWQCALEWLKNQQIGSAVMVYLDAPYKREEYSRYYHVLETLVEYHYPSSIGLGRGPDKAVGERFRSEFFTRREEQMREAYIKIIKEIALHGWKCGWSISDTADVNIVDVVESIVKEIPVRVRSFAVPHQHKSQGGRLSKEVIEYLILFSPR